MQLFGKNRLRRATPNEVYNASATKIRRDTRQLTDIVSSMSDALPIREKRREARHSAHQAKVRCQRLLQEIEAIEQALGA